MHSLNSVCGELNVLARVFIDFWNLQLNIIHHMGSRYRMDWKGISPVLIGEAEQVIGQQLSFDGTHVYASYDPRSPNDKKLRAWLNTLDHFPGIGVTVKERKTKTPPRCPSCHRAVDLCPHCGARMIGTVEKGIDTAIATDMISLAWEGAWDVAVLVSSDRDFIPVVTFLSGKGKRVLNAHFPPQGADLAKTSWAGIDIALLLPGLQR